MKKSILGLRTTIYRVPDLQAAKAWYTKAFEVEPYFDEPFYIGFNIGGYELGLQPDESTLGDNVITYWGVTDINTEYNRFIAAGATVHEEPQNVGGEIWVSTVKDPWGNVIGLIYNPEFKAE
ncbi:VOC family protein [Mucilaginibacter sp. JRF]|uniref:VOC family protein n=1 Tax=Mucilaginibacter sp. JRF TaxID=2780088 RepID=UPI001882052F|nr:VOC family protein [Mucilaginibacter sp. JRF]MBE9584215.1 VOC family protein [Mucilaginibacter sp. JRF]